MTTNEHGSVTAFVVVIFATLMLLGGLVIDGGLLLAAKQRADSTADFAALAASQAIDEEHYRDTGRLEIDFALATSAANSQLARSGVSGSVATDGGAIVVTTWIDQRMQLLGLAGIGTKRVTGVGRARLVQGVSGPMP